MKWFLMIGLCLCSLAIGQEPIPDPGGGDEPPFAECERLLENIEWYAERIAAIKAEITAVETLWDLNVALLVAREAELAAARAQGLECGPIMQDIRTIVARMAELREQIAALDERLRNYSFRSLMTILKYIDLGCAD